MENTILESPLKLDKFLGEIARGNLKYASELLDISYADLIYFINLYNLDKYKQFNSSRMEEDLGDWLRSLDLSITTHNRAIINPKELDVYLPDYNLAIEFNGNYWHSINILGRNYHQEKTFDCLNKNIRLIHIYEFEWNQKRDVIEKYLRNILDLDLIRLEMKDCCIEEVSTFDATLFLDRNLPLTQLDIGDINIAIKKSKEIISLMSFKQLENNSYLLGSFTDNLSYNLSNSYHELLRYFEDKYKPSNIVSFCDIGKYWGSTWEKLGFELTEIYRPEEIYNDSKNILFNSGYLKFEKGEAWK